MSTVERSFDARILKADAALQVAWGVVLEPRTADDPDTQGDWYTAEDIRKAAHRYMSRLQKGEAGADLMHEGRVVGEVVESFVAPADMRLGDQDVPEGAWVAAVHYPDAAVWEQVVKGDLGAFSVGGRGKRIYGST